MAHEQFDWVEYAEAVAAISSARAMRKCLVRPMMFASAAMAQYRSTT